MGLTNKQIIEALEKSGGIILSAANKLGCSRQTIYSRMEKSTEIKEAKLSAEESGLDLAETKLMNNIRSGDNTCIIFYLKTKGKRRGYIERQEVQQSGTLAIQSTPKIVFSEPKKDKKNK
tara:strand:+ start:1992 stop:2351 length:360 start_codon:yes stop_codon:yes gene_type:complete